MKLNEQHKILLVLVWIPAFIMAILKWTLYLPYVMIGKINTITDELNLKSTNKI